MDQLVATYESDGRFALSADLARQLGIKAGAQFNVTVQQKEILLRPVKDAAQLGDTFDESAIEDLRAMLAGGPSLEDELLAHRRSDKW